MENNIRNFTSVKKVYNKSIHTGYEVIENEIVDLIFFEPIHSDKRALKSLIDYKTTYPDLPVVINHRGYIECFG